MLTGIKSDNRICSAASSNVLRQLRHADSDAAGREPDAHIIFKTKESSILAPRSSVLCRHFRDLTVKAFGTMHKAQKINFYRQTIKEYVLPIVSLRTTFPPLPPRFESLFAPDTQAEAISNLHLWKASLT